MFKTKDVTTITSKCAAVLSICSIASTVDYLYTSPLLAITPASLEIMSTNGNETKAPAQKRKVSSAEG